MEASLLSLNYLFTAVIGVLSRPQSEMVVYAVDKHSSFLFVQFGALVQFLFPRHCIFLTLSAVEGILLYFLVTNATRIALYMSKGTLNDSGEHFKSRHKSGIWDVPRD